VRTTLAAAALALALTGASTATAADAPTVDKSPLLWSTINICDAAKYPDTIGIRASMPGSGRKGERMYMRFQVQYFKASANEWANGDATADSGFRSVGAAKYRRRESGWNFSITPPPAGQTYRLRGIVTFEWRKGDEVVRRVRTKTHSGHGSTTGADPKGFSAAECTIKPD
jgi:opacity protein-like surface antigen